MVTSRHTAEELRSLQVAPLEEKILLTKNRIREWIGTYGTDGVYVSFSGGKDSTVLLHIVRQVEAAMNEVGSSVELDPLPQIPAVFVNTGLEYPEIQRFAMSQPGVVVLRPEMRFDQVILKYGYPVVSKEVSDTVYGAKHGGGTGKWKTTRLQRLHGELLDKNGNKSMFNCEKWAFLLDAPFESSARCCAVMKKKPFKKYERETGRKAIVGTLAEESRLRRQQWLRYGCNSFEGEKQRSAPMSFWTEQDVLHYIQKFHVPICSVYGEIVVKPDGEQIDGQINLIDYLGCYSPEDQLTTTGCKRTGCIFCMYGCHLEKEPNRFQRLKETHPRQYQYCIGGGEMVNGKWQPNKRGLGLKTVLEYIGVDYE